MRVVLAIVVGLACPSAVAAQAAGDRYGPPSAARLNAAAAAAYHGPTLSWSNKLSQPQAAPAALPQAPSPHRATAVYAPFQPQVPLPLRAAAPPPAAPPGLPTSLYSRPAPSPTPASAPAAAALAPAPVAMAAAPPSPRAVGGTPRLYSVHRGYGWAPDAIPAQAVGDRYVLIGPPDAPKARDEADDQTPDVPAAF